MWDMTILHHPPQNLAQLIYEVQFAQNKVPQADIHHLILSIAQTCTGMYSATGSPNIFSFGLHVNKFLDVRLLTLLHCQKIKIKKLFLVGVTFLMSLTLEYKKSNHLCDQLLIFSCEFPFIFVFYALNTTEVFMAYVGNPRPPGHQLQSGQREIQKIQIMHKKIELAHIQFICNSIKRTQ